MADLLTASGTAAGAIPGDQRFDILVPRRDEHRWIQDGRDWCAQCRQRALMLMDAIAQGAHAALVRSWRMEPVRALKRGGLEGAAPAI